MPGRRVALLAIALVAGCEWGDPHPWLGTVTDAAGAPLEGVVVSDGQVAALTDAGGAFSLAGASGEVTLRKPGYRTLSVSAGRQTGLVLPRSPDPVRVAWDMRWQSPSTVGLMSALASAGVTVTGVSTGDLPAGQDTYVLPSPAWFDEVAHRTYRRLASAGATLVVLGEWGGYDGVDLTACNAVAEGSGIRFDASLVRLAGGADPDPWIGLKGTGALFAGCDQGVRFFTAGSLTVGAPGRALLETGDDGVRIQAWDRGPQTLVAVGPLGRGKVLAIADTGWASDEQDAAGSPHWRAVDNARFARNAVTY